MISRNLRVLMAERNVNIQDVADSTLLSRTTISGLVNGKVNGVHFKTLLALSEYFNVPVSDLFKELKAE